MKFRPWFKHFSVLMVMALLLSSVSIAISAENPESNPTWNSSNIPTTSWQDAGNYDTGWYNENQTSYEIDTEQKLAGLAVLSQSNNFAGKTIYITADMDLRSNKWYEINPSYSNLFRGSIEGKKNGVEGAAVTISNMICYNTAGGYRGFIRSMGDGGLKNLIFDNAYVVGKNESGVICGNYDLEKGTVTTDKAVFENLTVKNSYIENTNTGECRVGAVFGTVKGYGQYIKLTNVAVENCTVKAAGSQVGGIIGRAYWGKMIMDSCSADVTINGGSMVGGLVGYCNLNDITMIRCSSSGSLECANGTRPGAMIAHMDRGNDPVLADCHSTLEVSIAFDALIGQLCGGGDFADINMLLLNCSGKNSKGVMKGIGYVGGMANYQKKVYAIGCNLSDGEPGVANAGTYTFVALSVPTLLNGASVRTVEGSNGLRFTTTVNGSTVDALGQLKRVTSVGYGTLICVAEELNRTASFTKDALDAAGVTLYTDITARNGISQNEDGIRINAALIGLEQAQKGQNFAARSYIEIQLNAKDNTVGMDGGVIRVYSDFREDDHVRSMEYVANRALNDVKDAPDSTGIFPYVNMVGDYNADSTGETYQKTIGEKYSCYSSAAWIVLKNWASAESNAVGGN